MKNWIFSIAAAGAPSVVATFSRAQGFPTKPMRFIAPFPAAGSSDLLARILSQRMGEQLGQPVVVDNRPGASRGIGRLIFHPGVKLWKPLFTSWCSRFCLETGKSPPLR